VKSSNLRIAHQCPQCGAPVTLDETDRLLTCEYCRVKSYLITSDCFQYVLPNAAPENKNLLFFPYWRFKGMLFSCISDGVRQKFIDVSHQAIESPYFPISLGLRPQALKLRFLSQNTKGVFLRPHFSFEKVLDIVTERFSAFLPKPIFHQAHIGESLSLIYSPHYLNHNLYDAILNEPIATDLPHDFEQMVAEAVEPDWRIRFLPTLCPGCGWDLEGHRDAMVLLCRNCNSACTALKDRFVRVRFAHVPDNNPNTVYLPFWRIKTALTGIDLDSFTDFVNGANLPNASKIKWQDQAFYFWSPAFKIRPQTFLPLATKMTLSEIRQPLEHKFPDSDLYSVNLPIEEAVETMKINLANLMKHHKTLLPRLPEIQIQAGSYLLVYVPFLEKHRELTQPDCNFTITKTHLSLADNL
jgi:hypothetical protein